MSEIGLEELRVICRILHVNLENISIQVIAKGANIELREHGRGQTNILFGNRISATKIALAHINEFPDYYDRLEKMEREAKKYWANKSKPKLFY